MVAISTNRSDLRKARMGTRGAWLIPVALALWGAPAAAEMRPTLNFYGATGLIDMPSGEAQPDGQLSVSTARFGTNSRTTLSFQVTPRLSASFRFASIRDWNKNSACYPTKTCTGQDRFETYYDRSFDLRYQVFRESRYLPSVTIGLQDFAGTGLLSGEYVAATKAVLPNLKVTAGLGWGRLGSYGSIGSPFGARPATVIGFGGDFNAKQWFRGPAAPFGGIEWKAGDAWTLKAEYSSDIYTEEDANRGTFRRKSPFNLGIEYQASENLRVGGYFMSGSEVGIAAHYVINPKLGVARGLNERAPNPIAPRPSRKADPGSWTTDWVTQENAGPILRDNIANRLAADGIVVESFGLTATTAQIRIRNVRYDSGAQAIGRTARAMSQTLPASVEVFEIVPVVNGLAASKVTLRRTDLESLEFSPDAAAQMRDKAAIGDVMAQLPGAEVNPAVYPAFVWSVGPYGRFRLFDQKEPMKLDVGVRAEGRYELRPGLTIEGSVAQKIAGNLNKRPSEIPERMRLQPVRSAVYYYDRDGTTALEKLTVNWNSKLSPSIYSRVSLGYFERMFGGISTEVLWKPAGSRLAFGAEVNYVKQRSPDGGFGFKLPGSMYQTDVNPASGPASYSVVTGNVSAYYELAQGFHVQLDVGRYLAGDVGATLSVNREFANGWKVGAFATKTNVSAKDFGSGSFDKGIRIEVPMTWFGGKPTRQTSRQDIRPFGRDGGARLSVDNRLYGQIREYQAPVLNQQFGRFWK